MQNKTSQQPVQNVSNIVEETFLIEGMTCGGCVRRARSLLEELPVEIKSIEIGQAILSYDVTKIGREDITRAISEARNARTTRKQP